MPGAQLANSQLAAFQLAGGAAGGEATTVVWGETTAAVVSQTATGHMTLYSTGANVVTEQIAGVMSVLNVTSTVSAMVAAGILTAIATGASVVPQTTSGLLEEVS